MYKRKRDTNRICDAVHGDESQGILQSPDYGKIHRPMDMVKVVGSH